MLYPVLCFAVLAAAVLILNTKAYIVIEYIRSDSENNLKLSFCVLIGPINYRYNLPKDNLMWKRINARLLKGWKEGIKEGEGVLLQKLNNIKSVLIYFRDVFTSDKGVVGYLKKKAVLKEYTIQLRYGTGDAFSTGIAGGVVWTLAGVLTAFFESSFRIREKHLLITPDFAQEIFNLRLHCIFELKAVNIIIMVLKMIFGHLYRKLKKAK